MLADKHSVLLQAQVPDATCVTLVKTHLPRQLTMQPNSNTPTFSTPTPSASVATVSGLQPSVTRALTFTPTPEHQGQAPLTPAAHQQQPQYGYPYAMQAQPTIAFPPGQPCAAYGSHYGQVRHHKFAASANPASFEPLQV